MATHLKNLSVYEPDSIHSGMNVSIGIVVSDWNQEVTFALSDAAEAALLQHGVQPANIFIHHVPGSFELPMGAQFLIDALHPDAVILLGCVIQGETRHFDFICQAVAQGCMELGLKSNIPAIFGVLTTNTLQQALDRAGGIHGNKGVEAAVTALQMIALKTSLSK